MNGLRADLASEREEHQEHQAPPASPQVRLREAPAQPRAAAQEPAEAVVLAASLQQCSRARIP